MSSFFFAKWLTFRSLFRLQICLFSLCAENKIYLGVKKLTFHSVINDPLITNSTMLQSVIFKGLIVYLNLTCAIQNLLAFSLLRSSRNVSAQVWPKRKLPLDYMKAGLI